MADDRRRAMPMPAHTAIAAAIIALTAAFTAAAQPSAARVVVAEYDGIIHPVAAEFFDDVVTHADASGARVIVLVLRTPGGLVDSTRTIVTRLISSRAPVVVFISPSGARAASAGFLLTLAADVAVMSPGTHVGAAHPVPAGGEGAGGEVMAQKSASDTAAYARSLADARGRNSKLTAEAVLESRAFTEREALAAAPPMIDFVATDLDDLLRQLDGRTVTRFDGRTVQLATHGATIARVEMSRRQTVLGFLAHPQIAYLLLTFGTLGLVIELWNPGLIAPGAVGAVCLLLAFFAFQIIPINVSGVLLIVLGVALLGAEAMSPSFGVLGIAGVVALFAGSLLITREVPGITISYGVILPTIAVVAIGVLGLGRLAFGAQRLRSVGGAEALVGRIGVTLTPISPPAVGQIRIRGEIWRATSEATVAMNQQVLVTAFDGLTLHVQPVETSPLTGGGS